MLKLNTKTPYTGSVVYQIYPRSFKDTDNNGIGDLAGITEKLGYLQWLGVDVIWLSPFYSSPMADFGYDVSNYEDVDPLFGSLNDFNHLVNEAHRRGIKIFMDFVPNHTSCEHLWFVDSRSSPASLRRDWYVWSDPGSGGGPPNNWLSIFGGPAWEFDTETKQYYLHTFLKEQPDLNWHNPEVRSAMKDMMRFWLNKGVDGFRADAVYWLAKDPELNDDAKNPHFDAARHNPYESLVHTNSRNGPKLFVYLKELAAVVAEYPDRFLVTEVTPEHASNTEEYLSFYTKIDPKVLAPFNFDGLELMWEASKFKRFIDGYQEVMKRGYLPVYVLGNHDKPRLASRIGPTEARAAALMLLTLPGMPFIYYGDEIGMENTKLLYHQHQDQVENVPHSNLGRDPERSPMQWTDAKYGGFSGIKPWLPLNTKL